MKPEQVYFLLFTIFIILLFIVFYYLNHKYYKFESFKNYILIITALSTLTLAIGVLFQVLSYKISEDTNIIQSFSSFSTDYFDSIIEIFSEHPEMNYYYNELFNGKRSNMYKRNMVLEHQLNTRILAKTVEQIAIINTYQDVPSIEILNDALIKILTNFFKSDKFRTYYVNYYKPRLAGPMTIQFIQQNFGI